MIVDRGVGGEKKSKRGVGMWDAGMGSKDLFRRFPDLSSSIPRSECFFGRSKEKRLQHGRER